MKLHVLIYPGGGDVRVFSSKKKLLKAYIDDFSDVERCAMLKGIQKMVEKNHNSSIWEIMKMFEKEEYDRKRFTYDDLHQVHEDYTFKIVVVNE